MIKGFFRGGAPRRIYADAAAATPIHPKVEERLRSLLPVFANPGALHKEALHAKSELEKARKEIAQTIGVHTDEIFFTGSGTEANNLALLGTLHPLLRKNKHIHAMTLAIEHQSVLEPLEHLKKYGLSLSLLPVDGEGLLDPRILKEALIPQTALVSVQLVNSEIGTIEPLRDVAKAIRFERKMRKEAGNPLPLYFHTDAAQAPLYMSIAVEQLGVDLLTLDAQKVLGPKSIGILYVRRGTSIEPSMFGGRQERGMRPGTENTVLAGAFAEALVLAKEGVEDRAQQVREVRDYFIEKITQVFPDVVINGSREHRIANNVNLSIPGLEGETAVIALDARGIAISTRSACVTRDEDPSHVIVALGVSRERAREAIRITFLPDVTKAEAEKIVEALQGAHQLYR